MGGVSARSGLDEVGERYVESMGDEQQVIDECAVSALLDPVDRLPVEVYELGELFLAQPLRRPRGADVVPDLAASVEDPVGQRIGWHPYTLAGVMIIVCTIVGTA